MRRAESIVHESICLDVQPPGHPANAEALELSDEAPRLFVQLLEMCFAHGGDTIYLVHHELRVNVNPDSLDPYSRASFNPSISAWYSATLWVAGPIAFDI
jgi:hypothetical protein